MPSPLLSFLKYIFLAFLYLFFLRVLRAVWIELREPKAVEAPAPSAGGASSPAPGPYAPPDAMTTMQPSVTGALDPRSSAPAPPQRAGRLVVATPAGLAGTVFELSDELTIGRSPGCGVSLPDDTFISSVHARVFNRGGDYHVEDLGSTNGTFLNQARVSAPARLQPGDRLQVGQTVLELST